MCQIQPSTRTVDTLAEAERAWEGDVDHKLVKSQSTAIAALRQLNPIWAHNDLCDILAGLNLRLKALEIRKGNTGKAKRSKFVVGIN
jgi:hypothetical protein